MRISRVTHTHSQQIIEDTLHLLRQAQHIHSFLKSYSLFVATVGVTTAMVGAFSNNPSLQRRCAVLSVGCLLAVVKIYMNAEVSPNQIQQV